MAEYTQEISRFDEWLIKNKIEGRNVDERLDSTEGAREYEAQWVEDNTPPPYEPSDPTWTGPDLRNYGQDGTAAENESLILYLMSQGLGTGEMYKYVSDNNLTVPEITGPGGANPYTNPVGSGQFVNPELPGDWDGVNVGGGTGTPTQPFGPFPGEWNGEVPDGYRNPNLWQGDDYTYTGPTYDNSGFSQGGGGGGTAPPIDYTPMPTPDLTGYESSSNKDFYQNQFANMLGQEGGNDQREMASAIRREQAANAPSPAPIDYAQMWSDVGVTPSQAVQGGTNADGTPGQYTWGLNNLFGGQDPLTITNKQYFDTMKDSVPQESVNALETFFDGSGYGEDNTWATGSSPTQLMNSLGPDLGEGNRNAFADFFNAGYVRSDLQTPVGGGPTAATGYAPPVGGF